MPLGDPLPKGNWDSVYGLFSARVFRGEDLETVLADTWDQWTYALRKESIIDDLFQAFIDMSGAVMAVDTVHGSPLRGRC